MFNKLSIYTALLIILAALVVQLRVKKWDTDFGIVQGDVKGYYAYLPLLFIYDDIRIEHTDQYEYLDKTRIWYAIAPDGTKHIKYTMGMAILYAPFFFIAHIIAVIFGYPADGFSLPYQLMLALSSLFFLVMGIWVLRKTLKLYFSETVVAATLLVIYFGTNLFIYYSQKLCVSHGYSFTLIAAFLYASVLWLKNHKIKWAVVLGITGGLMVLIRPVDIVFFLFPLLFGIDSWWAFPDRLQLFRKYLLHIVIVVLLSFLIILPQLIYWKYITGHFVFDSYTDEHFYFLSPNIFRAVFSYRNGWLVYSPVMLFSLIGIFQLRRHLPRFFAPMVFIVPVYIYIIASWWCWWYVGFGNRAFINLYPLLSIAMAVFIRYIFNRKKAIKMVFVIVFGSLILFSLFQTYQVSERLIHWDSMSKTSYWDSFGRRHASQLFPTLLSRVDIEEAKKGKYVIFQANHQLLIDEHIDFESKTESEFVSLDMNKINTGPSLSGTGTRSIHSPNNSLYALDAKFPLLDADEVYITVWIKNNKNCALILTSTDSVPFFKTSKESIHSKNNWKMLNIFARFSEIQKPDSLHFFIYNPDKNEIWIDDFHIITRKVDYQPQAVGCEFF
jgi:MFS family permease